MAWSRLYIGLGRYDRALPLAMRSLTISEAIGNIAVDPRGASNVALCYRRLGRFMMALVSWTPLRLHEGILNSFKHAAHLVTPVAVCNAMIGNAAEATGWSPISMPTYQLTYPAWLRQGWSLQEADVLYLAGNERDAIRSAEAAVEGHSHQLMSTSFAGEFARWVALLELRGLTNIADKVFGLLESSTLRLDFYDRVEDLLCC